MDKLLLYVNKLVILMNKALIIDLIHEAHDQISLTYPGKTKITQLLGQKYYWKGLSTSVAQYIRNCHTCKRAHVPRDRTPGLLHPLLVPDQPW